MTSRAAYMAGSPLSPRAAWVREVQRRVRMGLHARLVGVSAPGVRACVWGWAGDDDATDAGAAAVAWAWAGDDKAGNDKGTDPGVVANAPEWVGDDAATCPPDLLQLAALLAECDELLAFREDEARAEHEVRDELCADLHTKLALSQETLQAERTSSTDTRIVHLRSLLEREQFNYALALDALRSVTHRTAGSDTDPDATCVQGDDRARGNCAMSPRRARTPPPATAASPAPGDVSASAGVIAQSVVAWEQRLRASDTEWENVLQQKEAAWTHTLQEASARWECTLQETGAAHGNAVREMEATWKNAVQDRDVALDAAASTSTALKASLADAVAAHAAAADELAVAREAQQCAEDDMLTTRALLSQTRQQANEARAASDAAAALAATRYGAMACSLDDILDTVAHNNAHLSAAHSRIERLQEHLGALQARVAAMQAHVFALEAQHLEDASALRALEDRLSIAQNDTGDARASLDKRSAELAQKSARLAGTERKLTELQRHVERSAEVQANVAALQARADAGDAECSRLREQLDETEPMRATLGKLSADAREQEKLVSMYRRSAAHAEQEHEATRAQLAQMQVHRLALEQRADERAREADALREARRRLAEQVRALQSAPRPAPCAADEHAELRERVAQLEMELGAKAAEVEDADTRILHALKENKRLVASNAALQQKLRASSPERRARLSDRTNTPRGPPGGRGWERDEAGLAKPGGGGGDEALGVPAHGRPAPGAPAHFRDRLARFKGVGA
ncbi:hypothetical protein MSPP1_003643 [Malassezia sp. CBS 17886]|nr:hypothetical protein MSPP1_003643 [Malassezia sp. CBS 17886]